MTPLRQSMIEAMQLRGFSPRTHESYLSAVEQLARHYHRSPDTLSLEELQGFFTHLVLERHLSPASCRLYLNGVRFFYLHVLGWQHFDVPLVVPKRVQRIPELLTRAEIARLLRATQNPKHRMLLGLCYGCGLRVSELVAVRVRDIDGERAQLRVEQGKGHKDRRVTISPHLLQRLRHYWQAHHPVHWLFPSEQRPEQAISISCAQRVYGHAKRQAQIDKRGGIHALRHAYATHQLENGLSVVRLKDELGHKDLHTTLRYLHWVPDSQRGQGQDDLLAQLEVDDV